jgi:site-specific DNA recombinase
LVHLNVVAGVDVGLPALVQPGEVQRDGALPNGRPDEEDQFLDLVGNPDWPQDKIATRLRKIRDERGRLARQLDDTRTPRLDTATDAIAYLLDLLSEPQELYRLASKRARRVLNQTFFARMNHDNDGPFVSSDELAKTVEPLVITAIGGAIPMDDAASTGYRLRAALAGAGSSKPPMVEVPGIEPGSSAALSGLLRAQLAMPLLGPSDHASESV